MNKLKIVLLGDEKSGKTTFLNRNLTGDFEKEHKRTMGVEIHSLRFETNIGDIILNVWDTGSGDFEGLGEGYWNGANGFLVFFDINDKKGFEKSLKYLEKLKNHFEEKLPHVVLCANKVDQQGVKSNIETLLSKISKGGDYHDFYLISAKSNYNFEKPFLSLIRSVFGENVHFVAI
jgi:GTP-binding nuclear protein Ran